MFPLRDDIPPERTPYVNYVLIALNAAGFLYELSLPPPAFAALLHDWGLVPLRMLSGEAWAIQPAGLAGSLVTHMFLHGGWMHALGNLWFLWIFGDNVEDALGHVRYLLFYLLAGVGAALGQYMIATTSMVPMIGASGAISGVLGAYLLLYPRARIQSLWIIIIIPRVLVLPVSLYLGIYFIMQLTSAFGQLGAVVEGGVAFWAHIAGFVSGCGMIALGRVKPPAPRRR